MKSYTSADHAAVNMAGPRNFAEPRSRVASNSFPEICRDKNAITWTIYKPRLPCVSISARLVDDVNIPVVSE